MIFAREFLLLCTIFRFFYTTLTALLFQAVAAEKAHISLINGVEHFDKSSMKHAETEEKNPLPPIEGKFFFCMSFVLILKLLL